MFSLRHVGLAAVLIGAFSASAFSQVNITGTLDSSGTTGDFFTIEGSGFGVKKPKVKLIDPLTGKKAKKSSVKVVKGMHDDNSILVEVRKGLAGTYDVEVKVKKDIDVAKGGYTILAPSLSNAPLEGVEPKEQITIGANHIGNKKPKILIGGQKAKVISFGPAPEEGIFPDQIVLTVPKKVANGTWDLTILSKVGTDTAPGVVGVVNSAAKLGKESFTALLDGKKFSAKGKKLQASNIGLGTVLAAVKFKGKGTNSFNISLVYDSIPATINGALPSTFLYSENKFSGGVLTSNIWGGNGWSATINAMDADGNIAGSFSGTLTNESLPAKTVSGQFVVKPGLGL